VPGTQYSYALFAYDGTLVYSAGMSASATTLQPPLSVSTTALPGGMAGQPYTATVSATGGTGPYTWSITAGALPAGLSLASGTGVISGTPTTATAQPTTFTVTARDSVAATDAAVLDVAVVAGGTIRAGTVSAGTTHSCAVTIGGGVKCWGSNWYGELGNNTTISSSVPVDVVGLSFVVAVSAGENFSCAVTEAGAASCWGYNGNGELGNGSTTPSRVPVGVSGIGTVTAISAGSFHSCAVTSAGAVKCWGRNSNGQLGDGTTARSLVPVAVTGLGSGVDAVAPGSSYTCAVTSAGGVKCWGYNANGQLGDGTTTESLSPVDVVGLTTGVDAVAAAGSHACALTTAGAVSCWGLNLFGQLGNGTTTSSQIPVGVVGLGSGASAIAAGGSYSCAVAAAGVVSCWGSNPYGGLGDGTTADSAVPVGVVGLGAGASTVTAGNDHSCAVTTAGTVKCWGHNQFGELGNGTTITQLSVPGYVVGLGGA